VVEGDLAGTRARRLLVLGAGASQLGLLEAARERGLHVMAADRDPSAPGFALADRRAIISAEDEHAIDRLAAAEEVDGIVAPGIDWPVGIAARVAERLGLPHPLSGASATLSTSKLRQRERFVETGVPYPRYVVCATPEEALAAGEELGFPCVVKAPDRQGQRGLCLVESGETLPGAIAAAFAESRVGACLVEELVDGRELTVNAFSLGGRFHPLTVTDRWVAEPPAFGVALAHVWPSDLDPPALGAAIQAAQAAAEALGIAEGPTYTQVLVPADGGRPLVGELAARLGGGQDADLCHAVLGVDLNALTISAALGEEIRDEALNPAEQAGGGVVRFLVAPPGELVRVDGLEAARDAYGIERIRIYRQPGHVFGELRRGSDRAGAVIAVGETRDEALERADRASESIRFVVAEPAAVE
jgi:biotin carboxylase